jgi:hypothetical protein
MRKQAIQQGRSGLLFALKGWPARSSIARVQRGSSEVARCASTEDHQAPSPLLFREQEDNQATLPLLFQCFSIRLELVLCHAIPQRIAGDLEESAGFGNVAACA